MQVFPDRGGSILAGASIGLAAQYAAALATMVYNRDSVQAHISMQSTSTACEVMPLMLSGLFKQKGWQDASIIRSVIEALYSINAHRDCDEQLCSLTCNCLLAVHSELNAAEIHKLSIVVDRLCDL